MPHPLNSLAAPTEAYLFCSPGLFFPCIGFRPRPWAFPSASSWPTTWHPYHVSLIWKDVFCRQQTAGLWRRQYAEVDDHPAHTRSGKVRYLHQQVAALGHGTSWVALFSAAFPQSLWCSKAALTLDELQEPVVSGTTWRCWISSLKISCTLSVSAPSAPCT